MSMNTFMERPRLPMPIQGGVAQGLDTEETCAELAELASRCKEVLRAFCACILSVPQFEAKIAFGLHIQVLADLFAALQTRRFQLARAPATLPLWDDGRTATIMRRSAPVEIVSGLYQDVIAELAGRLEDLLRQSNALLDHPTRRMLTPFAVELAELRGWGEEAVAAYLAADPDPAAAQQLASWLEELRQSKPGPAPCRPTAAVRDPAFDTFAHTRNYRSLSGVFSGDPYADSRLELVWVNRDEQDAVETFAIVLHDLIDSAPLDVIHGLGRMCADEARHALIGHRMLEELGLRPQDFPVSTIGIDLRARLTGWEALAQISLFGELSIIGPMRHLAEQARERGDLATARSFEFICSDEVLHLRNALRWLKTMHPAQDISAVEAQTRRSAARLLAERGLVREAEYMELSKSDIFALLGE